MIIKWLINTLRQFKDNGILEVLPMTKLFEPEKLNLLEQELQFTLLCIGRLTYSFNYYSLREGNDLAYKTLEQFKMDKIRLEVQISTLTEFLEE